MMPIQNHTDAWRPIGIAKIPHDTYKISNNHGARECGAAYPAGFISGKEYAEIHG